MAPTLHRAYFGVAATTATLPFFLDDPVKYWYLSIVVLFGLVLIGDDVIYHVSNGRFCALCKIFPE